jgi:hypothetical protein
MLVVLQCAIDSAAPRLYFLHVVAFLSSDPQRTTVNTKGKDSINKNGEILRQASGHLTKETASSKSSYLANDIEHLFGIPMIAIPTDLMHGTTKLLNQSSSCKRLDIWVCKKGVKKTMHIHVFRFVRAQRNQMKNKVL